jgi:hypothetical protein
MAFEHDGTMKWTSNQVFVPNVAAAIGIGNFDNAGSRHVGGGIASMLAFTWLDRSSLSIAKIVERDDAVGKTAAKGADIANRKDFSRNVYSQIAVIDFADMAARDQDLSAEAAQCRDRVGAPPQQRHWRRDHASA